MPRKNQSIREDQGSEGLMSEGQLSVFLEAFAKAQAESNRQLIEGLLSSPNLRANNHGTPSPTPSSNTASVPAGNFSSCSARFNGSARDAEVLEAFIDSVQIYKECTNVSDELALRGLPMLLEGEAAVWFRGVRASITSWSDALERLRAMFGVARPPHKIFRDVFSAEQQEHERADVFVGRLRASLAQLPYELEERIKLDIVYGLLHKRIRKRVQRKSVTSLDALIQSARDIEEALADTQKIPCIAVPDASSPRVRSSDSAPPAPPPAITHRAPRVRGQPSGVLHAVSPPPPPLSQQAPPARQPPPAAPRDSATHTQGTAQTATGSKPGKLFCVYCRRSGHTRDDCSKVKSKSDSSSALSCYGCGNKGVIRVNCEKCNTKDSFFSLDCKDTSSKEYKDTISSISHLTLSVPQEPDMSQNVFSNINMSNDLNNDSELCMCSNKIDVSNDSDNNATSLCTAGSDGTAGRPILNIQILGHRGTGLVDTAAKRSVAGSSLYALLQKLKHPFRSCLMSVKLADGLVRDTKVKLADVDVTLEGAIVPITFIIFPDAVNNDTLLGVDFLRKARVVLDLSRNYWFTADKPGVIHPLKCESSRNVVGCAAADILRSEEGTMLSPSERTVLADLLHDYNDIFRQGGGEPTPFAEHTIETGDHPPTAVPPYRLTPAKKAVMKEHLDKMLSEGIIEECESAWAAPALLVPKKDGSFRFCVDYRKLNAVTKSDSYPLPVIDDLLQYTGKSCYMSTIDLRSGYWQVKVREEDQDKTAFVTPFGVHRFKRMPFGLRNAPATFQRLIDRFRSGSALKDVTVLGYIDDLIVVSSSFEQHLQDLRAVFDRLRVFCLRANRDKCVFARERVKYLGHVITPEGVAPDPDKVSAITQMKEPTSLKHLQTFLQTCSWFRKFVPGFSQVAQPLTLLTKKDQPWKWGEAQAQAFQELKRLLTSAPILTQPDYALPFVLRTDASNYALGAVLLQGETHRDERPIEYASRLLTAAERNYSTTEREALAVVWAVEKFQGYIDGHQVRVSSDHQPLKWLLALKSPTGRLVRWAMKLQPFDLKLDYTPGKANLIADTLSRPPCDEQGRDTCGVCTVIVDIPQWDLTTLRAEQLADPEVSKIVKELEGKEEVGVKTWTDRGYYMSRGILYRYTDAESEDPQLVVPESLRKKVMIECHDSSTSGHGGIERTLHRVSQRFYFPGMRRYVEEYLKSCIECQRYKASNQKPSGLVQTPVPAQRFEVLAVDLFGPLPKGPNGERWILIVEDTASKWVEVFALVEATAEACAKLLIEEVFLRFGLPRRLTSDNGVQFVADIMQHAMFVLGVKQNLIPLYHPEANPVERKNRDLKTQLAILVEAEHRQWPEVLPFIRFAMNTSHTKSTGQTPAFLTFARELRSPITVQSDLRAIIEAENYVPQITPYLLKLADTLSSAKEKIEHQQDIRKTTKDKTRKAAEEFVEGDLVLLKSHVLSNAAKGISSKLAPKRDGPYRVTKKVSPTTYQLARCDASNENIGKYHTVDLRRYHARDEDVDHVVEPVIPKRRRGRPRKCVS